MLGFKRLAISVLIFTCLVSTGDARTKKGDKFLKDGQQAEIRKQWDAALDLYEKALLEDPADAAYMMAARRVRFQAGMARVDAGQKLRSQGQLQAALAEFQKAYSIDPSSAIAEQEISRTKDMIAREAAPGGRAATPEDRGLTSAEKAQQEVDQKIDRMLPIPELRPLNPQPLNLKMNNQPVKVLFETVGKLAGINVVFDSEYQPAPGKDRFTVDLSNTTLEEALDNLAVQTKSYWKALSPNSIFVTNDNVAKRRDYEDYVVKVFYIKNVTTIQELQEISVTIRSVTEIRRAYTYNPLNAILLRGTAEQISLAEKLISDLDKPRAEVVIDVIVMEANRGRVRDLAANLTFNGGSNGINLPIFYGSQPPSTGTPDPDTGETPETPAGTIPLNKIGSLSLGDFSTVVPGAFLQALMSDSQTRIVQQPQVRAVDNYKASLKIGDRVPYATGSFQPGSLGGGVGISPLVSTQFNYIDTGVNVEIVPRVHGRDEVSLHVEIDLNNVTREVDLGGLKQPVITQKKILHDIRLKQGEINLVGGLLQVQQTRTVTGIPGLANIPILGRLFGPEHVENNRGELLIAIIPHVVRAPDFTESNFRGVAAGPDANLKLNYAPRPVPAASPTTPAPAAAAPAPAATVAPVTPVTPAAAEPVPAATVPATPAPGQPPVPATPTPKPEAVAAPAVPAGGPRLVFTPGTLQTQLNSAVTVQLMVENVSDLSAAPVRIKYDPKVLRLTSIRPGSLMSGDGAKVNFTENTLNETGEATVTLNRTPGTGSVSGSGALLNLTFQATGRGTSSVAIVDAALKNLQMQPIPVQNPTVNIQVQ